MTSPAVPLTPGPAKAVAAVLDALLGPAPFDGAVLYVAQNQPPTAGTAPGSWIQDSYPDVERAAASLVSRSEGGETYAALAWFAPGDGRTKAAVVAKRSISADIDAKCMPGVTPQERLHQARTLARCLPCPAIVVGSGGGFHAHLLLPDSLRVESYADPADGVQNAEVLGRALRLYLEEKARELVAAPVALDHCHGAERVWRVPPGWNAKSADGARTLTADRSSWRPVTLEIPARPEGLASIAPADPTFLGPFLDAAAAEVEAAATASKSTSVATLEPSGGQNQPSRRLSVAAGVDFTGPALRLLLPAEVRAAWPMRDGDQSKNDWSVCVAMAKAGWVPEITAGVLRARRRLLPHPEDRAKGDRDDYVARTVVGAYEKYAPRPVKVSALEPQPFPTSILPEQLAEFIIRGSAALGCAPEAIALPHLTGLGSAIGNSRRIRLKRTWSEPPLLWSAVVMPSGRMKSPALDLGIRGVDDAQSAAMRAYKAAMKDYLRELEAFKHKERQREGDEATEGMRPAAPDRPILRRVKVSDVTIEALAPILEENPRGLVLVRDELAGWFKSFDAYRQGKGSDREHWLTAHRAGQMLVDRKVERQVIMVPHGFISVTGGIQPYTLRHLFTDPLFECGMAARLLLSQPASPKRRWTDEDIPGYVERAVATVFQRLFALELDRDASGELVPVCLDLTSDAKALWVKFYNRFAGEQELLDGEEELGAAFSKLEAYAARFALILEHVAWAAGGGRGTPTTVGLASLEAAIALTDWFAVEARRIYTDLGRGDGVPLRGRAWEWMRGRSEPVTARDLMRGPRPFRDNLVLSEQALNDLVGAGLAWRRIDSAAAPRGWTPISYVLRDAPASASGGDTQTPAPAENGLPIDGVSPKSRDPGVGDA